MYGNFCIQYQHKNKFHYDLDNGLVTYNDQAIIYKVGKNGEPNQLGIWTVNDGLDMKYSASTIFSGRRFFRVGTAKVLFL